ncbi:MAG TPA: sigma-70 family RNA polymerase sigma factor [Gemmatimonadales bacterium]|nr:sigma-70 family RNA polymerase sigma factor [Gemmatimonadales bacterium]
MTAAPTAFETELVPVLDRAYGLAYSLTHNRAEAEDLVQDAALLALKAFAQFKPGTNFKAWFYRILVNAFYGQLRKQRRQGETVDLEHLPSLYLYGKTTELGLQNQTDDPAGALLSRLDAESIVMALEALPDEYRVACALYFVQDFSYEEIAQTLDVPLGTVRSRIHRGRKLLQQRLWSIAEERGIVKQLKAQATA